MIRTKGNVRVIAFYLPQYHPIPENDEWWGKGFTEWTNVAMAKPLFHGHYQPRVPADLGFYDLRLPEVREAQAQMAKDAGIEGFMYWHYWFGNGRQLLERPFNEVLASGKPDFPFCLGWANHSWSRKTWTAKNKGGAAGESMMLLEQTYPGDDDYTQHFYSLLPAFRDHRYIRVNDKPFFLIYNILDIPDLKHFMELWQTLAKQNGLEGIHFVANIMGHAAELRKDEIINSGVDSTVLSNLFYGEGRCAGKLSMYWQKIRTRVLKMGPERYKYKKFIECVHNDYEKMENVYPVVYPQLDRTPRAGRNAVILTGSTPELFEKYLKDTIDIVKNKKEENRIVIINAWNEWGEGNYIEPDMKFGCGYLDACKQVLLNQKKGINA